jgi:hypothetical protein
MGDWIGLGFFVLLIVGAAVGLKLLSRPITRTTEEFERNAAEGTTGLGASMNALQELMNPEAAKAKEVVTQMKEGRYLKKKREGKANAASDSGESGGVEINA